MDGQCYTHLLSLRISSSILLCVLLFESLFVFMHVCVYVCLFVYLRRAGSLAFLGVHFSPKRRSGRVDDAHVIMQWKHIMTAHSLTHMYKHA